MTQTAAPSAATTEFDLLEEKIHRALELLTQARRGREEAEREAARLRAELAAKSRQLAEAERERGEVRRRIERLLQHIDALTNGSRGGE